jgi:hypothetical protein
METNTIFVVFLCAFLAFTGAGAIISALSRLRSPSKEESHSALETKLFKWSAPAGLVYGVVALLLVVGIIKFWSYAGKGSVNEAANADGAPRIVLKPRESTSVVESGVLITYNKNAFKASELGFQGVVGVSSLASGPFEGASRRVKRGDQFFIQLHDHSVWGINVLAEEVDMAIEIFSPLSREPKGHLPSESPADRAKPRSG